jgi:hypothetical protein
MTPPAVSEVKSAATQEAIAEEPLLPPKLLLGPRPPEQADRHAPTCTDEARSQPRVFGDPAPCRLEL